MKRPKKVRLGRSLGGDIALFAVLILFGAFLVLPLLYTIMQALKPTEEIFAFPPRFFVVHPTFDNFLSLSTAVSDSWVHVGRYIFNSIFVTTVAVCGNIFVAAMGGFPLAKMNFRGKKTISNLITYALLFTAPVTAFPQYIIMAKCHMVDTYWALLLPPMAAPLGIFLLKNFMTQLPNSVLEAAKIDGANNFGILTRIALPNVRSAILTLVIFVTQSVWNGGSTNKFIYSEEMKTLPLMLHQVVASGLARAGVGAAVTVVVMLFPLTIFLISQDRIIETMACSGIKE